MAKDLIGKVQKAPDNITGVGGLNHYGIYFLESPKAPPCTAVAWAATIKSECDGDLRTVEGPSLRRWTIAEIQEMYKRLNTFVESL